MNFYHNVCNKSEIKIWTTISLNTITIDCTSLLSVRHNGKAAWGGLALLLFCVLQYRFYLNCTVFHLQYCHAVWWVHEIVSRQLQLETVVTKVAELSVLFYLQIVFVFVCSEDEVNHYGLVVGRKLFLLSFCSECIVITLFLSPTIVNAEPSRVLQ